MIRRVCALAAAGLMAIAPGAAFATKGQIALTFDDLPGLTLLPAQDYVDWSNIAILSGLRRHHMPAIGFVNEGKLSELNYESQIANLSRWLDAGMDLGNHTYSHESPNGIHADAYVEDIAKGEPVTKALLAARHKRMVWFRHPYLETGPVRGEKAKINLWLAEHGYRIAPVTMENSDWMFSAPYDDALSRHDDARARHIRQSYLDYTDRMVAWYSKASEALLGRRIAFVMLMHVNRLNADSIDDLAKIFQKHELKTVTLETAMKDPAYRIHDPYIGPEGIDWQERWSQELKKDLPWNSFQDPPKDIQDDYKRVEPEG